MKRLPFSSAVAGRAGLEVIQRGLSSIGLARVLRRLPGELPFLQAVDDDSSLDWLKPGWQTTQSPSTCAATVSSQASLLALDRFSFTPAGMLDWVVPDDGANACHGKDPVRVQPQGLIRVRWFEPAGASAGDVGT